MYKAFHAVFGCYTVRLSGQELLPFVHGLAKKEILFWDLRKENDTVLLKTSLSCAELLLRQAAEARIEANIEKKQGLPFLLAKYKKRPGLLLGLFLGLSLIFLSELFVWKISVNGACVLSEQEIIEALDGYGIRVGSFLPKIPILKAQNEFLLYCKDISSVAINVKGTHIEVEVLERTHAPETEVRAGFCNLVAAQDGILESLEIRAGSALVKPGDVVVKGQLLVSSFTVAGSNLYYPNHALGKILAQVQDGFSVVIPLERTVKRYTGRETRKTAYTLLGKTVSLFLSEESPYERFDAETEKQPIRLFGLIELPLVRTRVLYREYVTETVTLSEQQAGEEARQALSDWLDSRPDEVLQCDSSVSYDQIQNACVLNASVMLRKDIAIDRPLADGELPPPELDPYLQP